MPNGSNHQLKLSIKSEYLPVNSSEMLIKNGGTVKDFHSVEVRRVLST
jgi:hypothetical protein